jgi:hypothetical protein
MVSKFAFKWVNVYRYTPGAPRPRRHTGGVTQKGDSTWSCNIDDLKVLLDLETEVLGEPLPAVVLAQVERAKTPKIAWNLKESIFGPRAKECDSKDYLDTDKIFQRMFELDWSRLQAKRTFSKYCPGRVVTPGCQISYMDHTGCHRLVCLMQNNVKSVANPMARGPAGG